MAPLPVPPHAHAAPGRGRLATEVLAGMEAMGRLGAWWRAHPNLAFVVVYLAIVGGAAAVFFGDRWLTHDAPPQVAFLIMWGIIWAGLIGGFYALASYGRKD